MEKKSRYQKIGNVFIGLTLVLSHVMVGMVAYNYRSMVCCGEHGLCSAPPEVALLMGIPFLIGIIICMGLGLLFRRKSVISGRD